MSTEKISVLIADDQELIRSGFSAIFSTFPDLEVLGAACNGQEAVAMAQAMQPDVVLMDIRMPDKDGLSATREITQNPLLKNTHVLVLTTFDLDQYVYDALTAGASGFLLKDADPEEIANAIRVVAKGDALIQPSVMRRLIETFVASRPRESGAGAGDVGGAGLGGNDGAAYKAAENTASATSASRDLQAILRSLTDREREILTLVARGLSNDQIAEQLVISPATVKTHVARMMAKTSSHDRAQLVVFAYESGLMVVARP